MLLEKNIKKENLPQFILFLFENIEYDSKKNPHTYTSCPHKGHNYSFILRSHNKTGQMNIYKFFVGLFIYFNICNILTSVIYFLIFLWEPESRICSCFVQHNQRKPARHKENLWLVFKSSDLFITAGNYTYNIRLWFNKYRINTNKKWIKY